MLSRVDVSSLNCDKNSAMKMAKNVAIIKTRKRILAFVSVLLLLVGVYFYIHYLNQTNNKLTTSRCITELTYLKYQLEVVTDYKRHLDKLLKESQKQKATQTDVYQDLMDSCAAMKHEAIICQHQFGDLQIECKKVKDNYDRVVKELNNLKTSM